MSNTSDTGVTQTDELSMPFDQSVIMRLRGFDYIPISEVIGRLNNVLGAGGWGYTIDNVGPDSMFSDWIIAQVSLTATVDGVTSTKGGTGGQLYRYDREDTGEIKLRGGYINEKGTDRSDTHKSAVSEAVKKAAQAFGVGLYLARDAMSLELEANEKAAKVNDEARAKADAGPVSDEYFSKLTTVLDSLSDSGRTLVMQTWGIMSEGRDFAQPNITLGQLKTLGAEAKEIKATEDADA